MVKDIVTDPIFLAQRSEPAGAEDAQVQQDLLDTLAANAHRCVGMAANMIGVRKTILAATLGGRHVVMVNPVITAASRQTYEAEEGCLCRTGTKKAFRHKAITVEYLDRQGKRRKQNFRDFDAQIIQHEIDHFSGKLI